MEQQRLVFKALLYRTKQGELFGYRSIPYAFPAQAQGDLLIQFRYEHYPATPDGFMAGFAAKKKQDDLVDIHRDIVAGQQLRNVITPSLEFLLVAQLTLGPGIGVQGGLDMYKMSCPGIEGHHIKFAIIPTGRSPADQYIPPHEISVVFEPFTDQLLQMIHLVPPSQRETG